MVCGYLVFGVVWVSGIWCGVCVSGIWWWCLGIGYLVWCAGIRYLVWCVGIRYFKEATPINPPVNKAPVLTEK